MGVTGAACLELSPAPESFVLMIDRRSMFAIRSPCTRPSAPCPLPMEILIFSLSRRSSGMSRSHCRLMLQYLSDGFDVGAAVSGQRVWRPRKRREGCWRGDNEGFADLNTIAGMSREVRSCKSRSRTALGESSVGYA